MKSFFTNFSFSNRTWQDFNLPSRNFIYGVCVCLRCKKVQGNKLISVQRPLKKFFLRFGTYRWWEEFLWLKITNILSLYPEWKNFGNRKRILCFGNPIPSRHQGNSHFTNIQYAWINQTKYIKKLKTRKYFRCTKISLGACIDSRNPFTHCIFNKRGHINRVEPTVYQMTISRTTLAERHEISNI